MAASPRSSPVAYSIWGGGADVVPELLAYAVKVSRRADWRFDLTDGASIPALDESADFVCFFSVFTHLTHEATYAYLAEAKRVLRAGGALVFSFLEFAVPSHWPVFASSVEQRHRSDYPLTQFLDRDAIRAFADHLGFSVENIWTGGQPHIPFDGEVTWDDGRRQVGLGDIGHSIAVLRK